MSAEVKFKVTVMSDFHNKTIKTEEIIAYIEDGDYKLVSIIPDKDEDDIQNVLIKLLAKKGV